ncbi:MAG: serine/threonine protein kinase [Desulfurococcales archaeon]|nr:serine/threonine protein kinase [Desulfurococcales archaeon]
MLKTVIPPPVSYLFGFLAQAIISFMVIAFIVFIALYIGYTLLSEAGRELSSAKWRWREEIRRRGRLLYEQRRTYRPRIGHRHHRRSSPQSPGLRRTSSIAPKPVETEGVSMGDTSGGAGREEEFPSALASRFKPLQFIGRGGFARVWLVEYRGERYALKIPVLPREGGVRGKILRSLTREAVHWEDLGSHPNIVRLYEWGLEPLPWLLLEYVEGHREGGRTYRSLADLLASRGRLPLCTSLLIARDTLSALEHAHRREIAHLDVKPSNILLVQGPRAKLTDWGLSRVASGASSVSGVTPAYMAPEHTPFYSRGKGIGWWTDIYQAGLVLFEMLTGRNYNMLIQGGEDPEEALKEAPHSLKDLLWRMLSIDPNNRPSARDALTEVNKLLSESCGDHAPTMPL